MAPAVGTRVGVYEITAQIGEGGMGQVFRARDTKLERDVAIKILPDAFAHDVDRLARLTREAKALAALNHPNIAGIHGLEESGGVTALVMEFVPGEDLSQRIARGAIPIDEALPIAEQIADAIEAAHAQGIVHRDLKPANIKVRVDGTVKVLDFGLAKAMEPTSQSAPSVSMSPTLSMNATLAGVVLGTAAYMSPEQASGKPVDERSDIWAFGVVLFEMLTGRPAFTGETVSHVLASVLTSQPDWTALATAPQSVRRLLRRCLEKDVRRRLSSIADARLEIDDALRPSEVDVAPPPAQPRRLLTLPVVVSALVALVASVLAIATAPAAIKYWRDAPRAVHPIWMEVRPLPGNTIGAARNAPQSVISPDAQQVVYSAYAADGVRHLWLQRFDRPEPQRLEGTDEGSDPFWAPDSRWVGFVSGTKILKVDVVTGTSQRLFETTTAAFAGGTWNQNGDIVISMGVSPRRLYRLSAVGGTPSPMTPKNDAQDQRAPQFLPDGHHVLFVANGTPSGIFVTDLDDSRQTKKIRDSDTPAIFAPTGHLLFSRDTTLVAQRFDLGRLEVVGPPFPVANGVSREASYSVAAAGALAFRPPVQTEPTQLTLRDRQGGQLRTIGEPAGHMTVALSPDEKQAAAEINTDGETDISLINLVTSIRSRFTFTHGPDEFPLWSTDGRLVMYASHRAEKIGIFVQPASGGPAQTINADASHPLDWSADGRYVLVATNRTLMALPTSGAEKPFPVVHNQDVQHAQFSPDGHWVTYSTNTSGKGQVWVAAFPSGAEARQISNTNGGDQPRWPRRSNEIIYLAADGKLMAVPVKAGATFDAGPPQALFPIRTNPGVNSRQQYAVSADGQRFLVSELAGELGSHSPIKVVLNWTAMLAEK